MLITGYVKLFKSLKIDYKNNDLRVYLHLLLGANIATATLADNTKISKGQLIISSRAIAQALDISDKSARVALQHLADDKLITIQGIKNKYSIVTITDYDMQQDKQSYNYCKLYRSIVAAEWYKDDVTARLYYYLLLQSNSDNIVHSRRQKILNDMGITANVLYRSLNLLHNQISIDNSNGYTIKIKGISIADKTEKNEKQKNPAPTTTNTTQTQQNDDYDDWC